MECFKADFFQFFTKKRQNFAIGWTAGYSPSNPSNFMDVLEIYFPKVLSFTSFGNSCATRTFTFW